MTATLLDDSAIAAHLARIDADGYTILENAVEPHLVESLREYLVESFKRILSFEVRVCETQPDRGSFSGADDKPVVGCRLGA